MFLIWKLLASVQNLDAERFARIVREGAGA